MIEVREAEKELARLVGEACKTPADVTTRLKQLFGSVLERMLEAELDEHLGYDKHAVEGRNSGNSRNGYGKKTVKSEWGEAEIAMPRDRNGSFEPQVLEKRQTRTEDIEARILAMYAKGMSTRDIEDHVRDIYGADVSQSLICRITDKIMPEAAEWQSRPLDAVYPIVFLDGIHFKVRKEGRIVSKCVYTVLGIDMSGRKEVLGIWIADSESASFWTTVCNELKNRGVEDIFVLCRDNLSGFSTAVETVFPKTEQQLCIIHQIRNSTKYVSYKDLKPVMEDLKRVYTAPSLDDAEYRLEELRDKWAKKYPQILKSWDANWSELSSYFKYPDEVRRLIYTTNAVEGFHRMLRKYTKTKTTFPTDDAVRKSIYLSIREISKKWSMPIRDWGVIIGQLTLYFGDRLQLKAG